MIRALGAAGTNILDEAAGQKNADFEALLSHGTFSPLACEKQALKTMAASEHWSIVASEVNVEQLLLGTVMNRTAALTACLIHLSCTPLEVQFGKCLSTTIKSAVYLATWRGLKAG